MKRCRLTRRAQRNQELRTSKLYAATNKVRKATGKRSGLEVQIASHLVASGVQFRYEREIGVLEFTQQRPRKYLPDFELPNGIIVEAKGWWKPEDRQKMLAVKHQHPRLDIRMVFSNPLAKLRKGSKTTYAEFCERNGFRWAKGTIPLDWVQEGATDAKSAIEEIRLGVKPARMRPPKKDAIK